MIGFMNESEMMLNATEEPEKRSRVIKYPFCIQSYIINDDSDHNILTALKIEIDDMIKRELSFFFIESYYDKSCNGFNYKCLVCVFNDYSETLKNVNDHIRRTVDRLHKTFLTNKFNQYWQKQEEWRKGFN